MLFFLINNHGGSADNNSSGNIQYIRVKEKLNMSENIINLKVALTVTKVET